MDSIYLIFYFLTILATGYAVTSSIITVQKRSSVEIISLILSLGFGTVAVIFFWSTLFGIRPCRGLIFAVFVISAIIILYLSKKNKVTKFAITGKLKKDEIILCSMVVLVLLFMFGIVTVQALMMPLYDVDAYGLWGLKAKALYHEGLPADGLFYQLPLSYSHLNYPLLVPFLVSGVYASIGYDHDLIGKIIYPFFYLALTCFMYSSLRWKTARKPALLLTLLFMTLPTIIRWNSAGIADVPLTLFYAGSVHYLVKYLAEARREDLILSILMTVFCAFVKNEGIAIAAINIGVFGVFYIFYPFTVRKLKIAIIYGAGIAILMIPWFFWARGVPHTHENYPLRLLYFFSVENLARIQEILKLFVGHLTNYLRWGILWLILPIAALINLKIFKMRFVLAMWALLTGQILIYIFVFIISPWTPEFLAEMALERILMHTTPAVIYLIAFHLVMAPVGNQKKIND